MKWFTLFLLTLPCFADFQSLPETRHKRFTTFGLFFEEKSSFLLRNENQALGSFGSSMALIDETSWATKPQLVLTGGVDVVFKTTNYVSNLRTEAFDARFGMAVDLELSPNLLFTTGLLHYSGHLADGSSNTALMPFDLGHDALYCRLIFDAGEYFRIGGTIRGFIHSDPKLKFFGADQFAEFFPLKNLNSTTSPTPYFAVGLEEGGAQQIDFTYHFQVGAYLGNHTLPKRQSTFRLAMGYYNGLDPRLKFAHYLNAKDHFFYGGLLLNY